MPCASFSRSHSLGVSSSRQITVYVGEVKATCLAVGFAGATAKRCDVALGVFRAVAVGGAEEGSALFKASTQVRCAGKHPTCV